MPTGEPAQRGSGATADPGVVASTTVPSTAWTTPPDATQEGIGIPATDRKGRLPMLDDRSPNPTTCPFLRAIDDEDDLGLPVASPDPANRCAALREPVPQSLRQQELVCLTSGHVNCPRYLRGAVVITDIPTPAVRTGRTLTPAIVGSLVVLALAFTASMAFVLARGDLTLPVAAIASSSPSASAAAAASVEPSPAGTPSPSLAPTPTPSPSPSPSLSPSPTPSLSPSPSPSPSPTPSPSPSPSPTPEPTPKPEPTSTRYALLDPCPSGPDCYVYTVRSGDNLYSIANYFGHSLSTIYRLNPWARDTRLRAGQELVLPPPRR